MIVAKPPPPSMQDERILETLYALGITRFHPKIMEQVKTLEDFAGWVREQAYMQAKLDAERELLAKIRAAQL